jgi:D-glycero-beta-D-manno-heptose-7-phosphate kinase
LGYGLRVSSEPATHNPQPATEMTPNKLLQDFSKRRILVVGDVMIDAYLKGKVTRISPEAPVPIVSFSSREERLGGAANVALNLLSLGASVAMCSVVGEDADGQTMLRLLSEQGINSEAIIQSKDRKTTLKTRVIGNNQQLLRVDQEQTDDITSQEEDQLISAISSLLDKGFDAIIFEDYNKGVLTEKVITEVIVVAKKKGVPTTVDPKFKNFLAYKGVSLFKPNLKELQDGLNRMIDASDKNDLEQAVNDLQSQLQAEKIFVTMSERGVFIQDNAGKHYVPAHLRSIADVSGAGDTVISVATLALVAGCTAKQIAEVANLAGGLVCEYPGVVAINKDQLEKELQKIW